MSDTFFSGAPHWTWFIIPYFFIGGLAGGAYFLAAILEWFGRPDDRAVVRTGYDVAAVGALVSGFLLTVDLGQPLRFWHMLFQSENFPAIVGLFGFFVAAYTGVLLSVTNRPIWADSPWLGALFVTSGASTGAATLILLAPGRGATARSLAWLSDFDFKALVVELLVLILFVASLGSVNRVWVGFWGLVLLVGVVGLGILAPLRLHMQRRPLASAAKLVLLGGFLLRLATIFV